MFNDDAPSTVIADGASCMDGLAEHAVRDIIGRGAPEGFLNDGEGKRYGRGGAVSGDNVAVNDHAVVDGRCATLCESVSKPG